MEKLSVLLVDDDKNIRQTLRMSLKDFGWSVEVAESAEEAIKTLRKSHFDFVLTDQRLGGKTGVELIRETRSLLDAPVVVVMTAYASFDNAVSAIQAGAFDYLPKPFTNAQLGHVLSKVKVVVELKKDNQRLRTRDSSEKFFEGLISPAILRLQEFVARVAKTDSTILVTGESGTGKTELAKLIHEKSARAAKPFVVVNCGTLTESLLESELFGHVRGAFTGATHDHIGKLEAANQGTIFIDEVAELSAGAQTRLLRFLQERTIERVGSNKEIDLDVRVIAATNKDLGEEVSAGRFREDLFYRLNVFECDVVPLRFRKEDVPVLIQKFLRAFSAQGGQSALKKFSEPALEVMNKYSWPGNVRELKNVIERCVVLSSGDEIGLQDLPEFVKTGGRPLGSKPGSAASVLRSLEEVEREHISQVLALESNQERAAEILGITTVTLWRKRKQYGLP